jgi:putative protease
MDLPRSSDSVPEGSPVSIAATTPIDRPRAVARPELLAPAGDRTCLIAAVENGADAVYFGLQGHNARARATNFDQAELPEVMDLLHRRGVRGYVTLNTLAFPRELEDLESTIRHVAEAGVDALIVQDVGLARLIRAVTPDLEIHASTQMSVTGAEGVRLAKELGCSRVILARELSLREIARIREEAELPVEVFVHGALCVAYSGQCLTSEALGGRSANRGECAQACRLPYEIVCDGEVRDLDDIKYLLSPQDLAAYDLIPRLIEVGVASLKIEGRLKTPEYVANITDHYRRAIDAAMAGRPVEFEPRDVQEMELSFSRGFSHGFFDGNNHKVLVRGDYAKKRGVFLGEVAKVVGSKVRLDLAAPVKPGDGLVFDGDEGAGVPEQGGRVYEVSRIPSARPGRSVAAHVGSEGLSAGPAELGFGRRDLDVGQVRPGQRVWKTDDPELNRRLRQSFEGAPRRKVGLEVRARAVVGEPLKLEGRAENGASAVILAEIPLAIADNQPATEEALRTQLDRLGGTVYELSRFSAEIEGGPLVPRSLLNGLRRKLVEQLDGVSLAPRRTIAEDRVLPTLRPSIDHAGPNKRPPALSVLCRSTAQIEAAVAAGISTIYAEFQAIKLYKEAVAAARRVEGTTIFLATPRIQKPGEANIFRYLSRQGADGLLVRNAGGLLHCSEEGIPFVADFSLNAANELSVAFYKGRGALRVAASYDLSFEQLDDLIRAVPTDWLEIVIHQQIPMFHMEHCVFCAFLSPGTDRTNCGRPCDHHDVKLRDRVGMEHPLKADVGCRNTLYNAVPQTAAEYLPRLLSRGVTHLRVEFLDDTPEAVARTIGLYAEAIQGGRDPKNLWRDLKATGKYGVTRGALAIL